MKKNKRINLIVIILVIIGIIFFVSKIVGNKNSKVQELAKVYNKLNSSQAYQFKWEQNDNNKTIIEVGNVNGTKETIGENILFNSTIIGTLSIYSESENQQDTKKLCKLISKIIETSITSS